MSYRGLVELHTPKQQQILPAYFRQRFLGSNNVCSLNSPLNPPHPPPTLPQFLVHPSLSSLSASPSYSLFRPLIHLSRSPPHARRLNLPCCSSCSLTLLRSRSSAPHYSSSIQHFPSTACSQIPIECSESHFTASTHQASS